MNAKLGEYPYTAVTQPTTRAEADAYVQHWLDANQVTPEEVQEITLPLGALVRLVEIAANGGNPVTAKKFRVTTPETGGHMSPRPTVYHFGCLGVVGHYMTAPGGRSEDSLTRSNPWGLQIDGYLCPQDSQVEGRACLHHKDGWTAIAFWDRSVDSRPMSNSAFLAPGTFTFDEMLALAREQRPEIVNRFRFAIEEAR